MEDMAKQGLFVWIKSLVESGNCPGVTWVDKELGIFQIPWGNKKSRNWQMENSSIFLEYAKHTCKYKPGDKIDYPKWKQNLKSAMNKNRFIERLNDHTDPTGSMPHRVYRFISDNTVKRQRRSLDGKHDYAKCEADISKMPQCPLEMNTPEEIIGKDLFMSDESMASSDNSLSSYRESIPGLVSLCTSSELSFSSSLHLYRGDNCEQIQGNIPTFVNSLCDNSNLSTDDEDRNMNTDCLQVSVPKESVAQCVNKILSTVDEISILDKQPILNLELQAAGNNKQRFEKQIQPGKLQQLSLILDPMSQSMQTLHSEFLVDNFALHSHKEDYHAQEYSASPDINFSKPILKRARTSLTDHFPESYHPTQIQKSEINSITDVSRNGLQNSSNSNRNDMVIHVQPSGTSILSPCKTNSAQNTLMVHNTQSLSFSELDGNIESKSDLPSNMDTNNRTINRSQDMLKESMNSGCDQFKGQQFTTYRECETSQDLRKSASISRQVLRVPDDSVMHVMVQYGTPHRTVQKVNLTSNNNSCRLFFGSVNCSYMQNAIKGHQNAQEVELPAIDDLDYNEKTKGIIRKVLKDMEQGIVISYRDGDIYVERRCLPRVYLSDGVSTSEYLTRSTKKRPLEIKVFDFNNNFKDAIERHKRNEGPVPKDHFFLTIGYEILPNDDSPTRVVPVYIVVRHVKAAYERFNILGVSTIAPNPMCSDPNSFDKNVEFFKTIDLKK